MVTVAISIALMLHKFRRPQLEKMRARAKSGASTSESGHRSIQHLLLQKLRHRLHFPKQFLFQYAHKKSEITFSQRLGIYIFLLFSVILFYRIVLFCKRKGKIREQLMQSFLFRHINRWHGSTLACYGSLECRVSECKDII